MRDYAYVRGHKAAAFHEKASLGNEQNRITLATAGGDLVFKQIAGALARRIVFYPRLGNAVRRGERIGMIKFGSRVDLFIPDSASPLVARGDKVKAGRTAVARWPRSA